MEQLCAGFFVGFFPSFQTKVGLDDLCWGSLPTWAVLWCSSRHHSCIFIVFCLCFYICLIFTGHYLLFMVGFGLNSVQGSKAHTVLSIRYSDFKACDERALLTVDFSLLLCLQNDSWCQQVRAVGYSSTLHVKCLGGGCVWCVQVITYTHTWEVQRGRCQVRLVSTCASSEASCSLQKCDSALNHISSIHQLSIQFSLSPQVQVCHVPLLQNLWRVLLVHLQLISV